jgi:hypothetical protein
VPGIDDALRRLADDPEFAGLLAANPLAALAGYDLSTEELELLARRTGSSEITAGDRAGGSSGAALRELLTGVDEAGGADLAP